MSDMQNFHYAITLALLLHDVDITDMDKAEEIGLIAYNFIGNHNTNLYRATLTIDPQTETVELPCNLLLIESVTYSCSESSDPSLEVPSIKDSQLAAIENSLEAEKTHIDNLYQGGEFVKYRREGNKLRVNRAYGKITILYHGEILDEDGLPYLNNKEAVAIADYLGYIYNLKTGVKTNNLALINLASSIYNKWLFHCDAARVPTHISQNDMDTILDAQTSWNRKKYHISYKPTL